MRRVAVGALAVALFSAPAIASVSEIDTDGDQMVSFEELAVAYADVTEFLFAEIDTSDDGLVDETELTAAVEGGKLVSGFYEDEE